MRIPFTGVGTALITPFTKDGSLDEPAIKRLVRRQIDSGVHFVSPCGTTGEAPTLSHREKLRVVELVAEEVNGKVPVLAGAGGYNTREVIELAHDMEQAGATGLLSVTPYYNKPTQDGMLQHFTAAAAAVSVPVVVYNIPGRSGIDLFADTLARICEKSSNVVATKEATGNVLRAQEIARTLGPRCTILSGDDALTLPMIAVGARGVISVTSNLYPAEVSKATRLALDGKVEEARKAHLALCRVHETMFVEANPSPVKAALAHKGRMKDVVRGPLARISEGARSKVVLAIEAYERG